jgi:hypothetical protein
MSALVQRQLGNLRATSLIGGPQGKIRIGEPGDRYEKEADQAASRVVSGQKVTRISRLAVGSVSSTISWQKPEEEMPLIAPLQRQVPEEEKPVNGQTEEKPEEVEKTPIQAAARIKQQPKEEAEEPEEEENVRRLPSRLRRLSKKRLVSRLMGLQRQEEAEEETGPEPREGELEAVKGVQAKTESGGEDALEDAGTEARIKSPGGGRPLTEGVLSKMEAGLGADFSGVRIHDTATDQADAGRLNAKAFAYRNHVWLGKGASDTDHKLMAHELTHVVQQMQGRLKPALQANDFSINDEETLAREADFMGARSARFESAAVAPDPVAKPSSRSSSFAHQPVVQREGGDKDVFPKSVKVVWCGDPFNISFERKKERGGSYRFQFVICYTGPQPVDGPFVRNKTVRLSAYIGAAAIKARINRKTDSVLEIDVYGDGSQMLKLSDKVAFEPRAFKKGREHPFVVTKNGKFAYSSSFWVLDPKATSATVPVSKPEEIPGENPKSLVKRGGTEIVIDGDGDQHKELTAFIKPKSYWMDNRGAPKEVTLEITQRSSKRVLNTTFTLPKPKFSGNLFPIVEEVTDGKAPTRISLVLPVRSRWLDIYPPTRTAKEVKYIVAVAGQRISFTFPVEKTPIRQVVKPHKLLIQKNIVWIDVKLGAYNDRFRLTIKPISMKKAIFGISPLSRKGRPMGAQGTEVSITPDAKGDVYFKLLKTGPVSMGIDMTRDGNPDLQIFDRLTTPKSYDSGGPTESNRNHHIRVTGPGIGTDRVFYFPVRNNYPQGGVGSGKASQSAATYATAVTRFARYDEIETELKELITRKKQLVEGGGGSMAEIDRSIDKLIKELRDNYGVRMTEGRILDAAVAGVDMLKLGGRLVQSPPGVPFMGERRKFHAELDYVPPGKSVEYAWRWKTDGREYRFLVGSAAMHERTKLPMLELDDAFWGMVSGPPAIHKAGGMEVLCHVYVGGSKTPSDTLSTGFLKFSKQIPAELRIVGAPQRTVKGARVKFRVGPWVPPSNKYSIDWYVDGKKVATDAHVMNNTFDDTGTFKVEAKVSKVRRSFGIHNKNDFRDAETMIEVLGIDAFGEKFMDELDKSPLRPKTPKLKELLVSIKTTIKELDKKISQGGDQKAYWEDRLKAQKKRLRKIGEHVPDIETALDLPVDPSKITGGQTYNGPIEAVLVMPKGGGAQPLSLYLTVKKEVGVYKARLIDVTSSKVLKFDGIGTTPLEAYEAVFSDWRADNEYPIGGRVVHRFKPSGWKKGNSFSTTTTWKKAKEWVDGIIMVGGLVVGALLLAAPDATITKVLGYVLLTAVVARSSVAIYERVNKGGDMLSTENILDGIAILTAFTGITGSVLRAHGINAVRPMMYRVGNWTIMSTLGADVGTFVYASAEAIASLKAIQANPQLDESQKLVALMRVMSSLFLSGALLLVTNRDLIRGGLKPTDFIKKDLPKGARPDLDVGTRLDVEYEIKQAGKWTKETRKLSDEAVLDQLFKLRARKEAQTKLAEFKTRLSPEAKAELREMSQGKEPEETWGWIERQKDPVKALEGRARAKRDAVRKVAEAQARFQVAYDQLTKSGFLSRPLVKSDIAAKDADALRGKIAEHLAELQAKKDYPTEKGYRVLDDIDVSEQFGTFTTKADAEASLPPGTILPLYELGGKVWKRLTNIDVLVVRDIKGKTKAEVSRYVEVKSGKRDSPSKAKKQQQTTIDAMGKIAAGDKTIRLHHHRRNDITDTVDASTATAAAAKTVGPDDKAFEVKLGVTQKELVDLAKTIIKEAHK